MRAPGLVDVDFSLAIHNRTGKYFIGQDLLATPDLPLGKLYFWGMAAATPPGGLAGRVLGRLQLYHIRGHALGGPARAWPRRRPGRPLLHLDPFTVPTTVVGRGDAVLCHDLGPVTHPELFDAEVGRIYRVIYDELAGVGPHMIFVSRASQAEFHARYPAAAPASSRVIYPAIRTAAVQAERAPVRNVSRPYLLTVGSLGDRKNQLTCIEAFARTGLARAGWQYVLCGPREPGAARVEAAALNTPGVVCLPYVSDAELSWLYANAAGFVLVSRLEGFGMPVAEAIAASLVPLITRDSVLAEVAGPAALTAAAEAVDEIADGMVRLAGIDPDSRREMVCQLRASLERFDLEEFRGRWRSAFADILAG